MDSRRRWNAPTVFVAVILLSTRATAQDLERGSEKRSESPRKTELRSCLLSFESREKTRHGTVTRRGQWWWHMDGARAAAYTETAPGRPDTRRVGVWTGEKGYDFTVEAGPDSPGPLVVITPSHPPSILLAALPARPLLFLGQPFTTFLRSDAISVLKRVEKKTSGAIHLLLDSKHRVYRLELVPGALFPRRTSEYRRNPGFRALAGFPVPPGCIEHPVTRELCELDEEIEVRETGEIDGFTLPTKFTFTYPLNTFVERCDIEIFAQESSVNTVVLQDLLQELTKFPVGTRVLDYAKEGESTQGDAATKKAATKNEKKERVPWWAHERTRDGSGTHRENLRLLQRVPVWSE